ncbi:MAG: hypothetical protein ACRD12_14815 [Acidimicrobiales bacterium]
MDRLRPPGLLDDFARRPDRQEAFARGWDAVVDSFMVTFAGVEGGAFFDARRGAASGEPERVSVAWDASPRVLAKWFEGEDDPDAARWEAAETLRPRLFGGQPLRQVVDGALGDPVEVLHRQQDEYCEWFVDRDDAGRIGRITLTCDVPEYWQLLASGTAPFFEATDERSTIVEGDIELVAELYREHVDPGIAVDDLLWPYDVAAYDDVGKQWYYYGRAGTYNPFNRWNTTHGAMHLTHPANTLVGEFRVAARAAVLRHDARGEPVDDAETLVCCSGFGEPNRSSDPAIGAAVNGLVRQGYSVSLADPVGLYIAGINLGAFRGPGGEPVDGAWRVDRGDAERQMVLRATFAAPPGAPYTVNEMRSAGSPIAYGGQIADQVQMIVTGLAQRAGYEGAHQPCVAQCCEHPDKPGVVAVVFPCATVDWADRSPLTGEPAAPPAALGRVGDRRAHLVEIARAKMAPR